MGKKDNLSDFQCSMIIDARWVGLKISKIAVLLGFSCTIIFRVLQRIVRERKKSSKQWKSLFDERGCGRNARFILANRKATVTQITTLYKRGI